MTTSRRDCGPVRHITDRPRRLKYWISYRKPFPSLLDNSTHTIHLAPTGKFVDTRASGARSQSFIWVPRSPGTIFHNEVAFGEVASGMKMAGKVNILVDGKLLFKTRSDLQCCIIPIAASARRGYPNWSFSDPKSAPA